MGKTSLQFLDEALQAALRVLKRHRIPYMVMGGAALSIWGRSRLTQDLDLSIWVEKEGEAGVMEALMRARFVPATPRPLLGHRLVVCRYLGMTRGLPIQVDFFFARGEYQRQAIRRAVEIHLDREKVRFVAPEDLILHKLLADRPIDRMDVRSILEEQAGRLNQKYLSRWIKHFKLSGRFQAVRQR